MIAAERPGAAAAALEAEPAPAVGLELPTTPIDANDEWMFDPEPFGPSGCPRPASPEDKR